MNTPWGNVPVSDAHIHFLSHGFYEALARQKGASVTAEVAEAGIEMPEADPVLLGRRWVQELDQRGVDQAALIASVAGDEHSVLEAVGAFPDRFYGYFIVDPTKPGAIVSVASALKAGMRGICFFPAMHRYSISDDRVTSILDLASGGTAPAIFVHCGVLSVGIRARLGISSHFDMRFSNPIDVHAVALRYPQLTFVIPHFGAGYFRESLMLADLCPNVYFDTSSSNKWIKYQVPIMDVRDAFRRSLDIVGPRRLLFGSDSSFFPRGWQKDVFDEQAGLLFDLGLSTSDAEMIFGGNLRRILAQS